MPQHLGRSPLGWQRWIIPCSVLLVLAVPVVFVIRWDALTQREPALEEKGQTPPAITPVPSDAGLSTTRPAP